MAGQCRLPIKARQCRNEYRHLVILFMVDLLKCSEYGGPLNETIREWKTDLLHMWGNIIKELKMELPRALNDRGEFALNTFLHHCSVSEDGDSTGTYLRSRTKKYWKFVSKGKVEEDQMISGQGHCCYSYQPLCDINTLQHWTVTYQRSRRRFQLLSWRRRGWPRYRWGWSSIDQPGRCWIRSWRPLGGSCW